MKRLMSSPKEALIKGAAWSLATRWGLRGVGFINTVVMARLVLPEDYGLVAMAFLVVGLIHALLDFSVTTALLRKDQVSRAEVDSAWSLRGTQGLVMACVMVAGIPLAQAYFQDDRVALILLVFALCLAVSGFSNIGMTLAQKQFDFALEFRFQLYVKVLSVVLTVITGVWLGDYRALLVGIATGYLGGVVFSYLMHPYRPRWSHQEWGSIWSVTRWLMVANVGGFVLRKGDEIVASRIGGAEAFGLYNVGADLGQMPAGEVGPAVLKSFLPVLASMESRSVEEVNAAVVKTGRVVAGLTLPLGLGFAAVAEPATRVILGEVWLGAVPYVAAFAVLSVLQVLGGPVTTLLTLRGHTRCLGQIVWLEFAAFVVGALLMVPLLGLMGLVAARASGALVNLAMTLAYGKYMCRLSIASVVLGFLRPFSGAFIMYWLVVTGISHVDGQTMRLLAGVVIGGSFYVGWCFVSWLMLGRPNNGLEAMVVELLKRRLSGRLAT